MSYVLETRSYKRTDVNSDWSDAYDVHEKPFTKHDFDDKIVGASFFFEDLGSTEITSGLTHTSISPNKLKKFEYQLKQAQDK